MKVFMEVDVSWHGQFRIEGVHIFLKNSNTELNCERLVVYHQLMLNYTEDYGVAIVVNLNLNHFFEIL